MRDITDIANDILLRKEHHLTLSSEELYDLFGTTDEDEIQGVIIDLMNLRLPGCWSVFMSCSGKVSESVLFKVNPEVLERYEGAE